MGKNSKDTWIKKLWNHMFQSKHKSNNSGGLASGRREKSDRTDRDQYYSPERSKSRQNNIHPPHSYSSSPTGRKSKNSHRKDDGRRSRYDFLMCSVLDNFCIWLWMFFCFDCTLELENTNKGFNKMLISFIR